jgi:hypothetical protein
MCDLLLTVVVGSILFPTPNPHITNESCEKIKIGMKLREVEAILGGKAGDYRTRPTRSCLPGIADLAVEDLSLTLFVWETMHELRCGSI